MTTVSLSFATSGVASSMWAQLQQRQAERLADQADQKASALRAEAGKAQATADRAQENARSLKVQSEQAQGEANSAALNLVTAKSMRGVQQQLETRHLLPAIDAGKQVAVEPTSSGVPNAQGQMTGALVNVTA